MTDSWRLKVKRAQRHMVEIKSAARAYSDRHMYEFVRVKTRNRDNKVAYRLGFIEPPDPMIAIMLGDFIHNLRSALDHVIVASVPSQRRKSAGFPVINENIWATNADGEFVVEDAARRQREVATMLKGLAPEAAQIVIDEQPFRQGPDAYRQVIGLISRLENADKHRRLITVAGGLINPVADWTIRGETAKNVPFAMQPMGFVQPNTILGWEWDDMHGITPSEMQMEIRGTVRIMIQMSEQGGKERVSFPLRMVMLDALRDVRRILRRLEPYVRR